MKRWILALVVLALLAGGGWVWGSPKYTLWQMKRAAEARDVDALARHVDFQAVRDSVKAQLSARMHGEGGGVLGALVRAGIADTVVDAAVSPAGMRVIFAAAPLAETERPGTIKLKANEMRYQRTALDRFHLIRGDGAALEFRLQGASWKLVDIKLPPDALP
ncbi:DUF2939 domain-containing protein [Sphingomonas sp. R-74633]|uniref:DUF2939 domain-containing protein n=1 Tax=Sphingomonas sp. R-74633 TaxID=2751188 RepID=UPI0015D1EF1D|nr:DUF2939 domain-containing protein [Sphingomonas sp. R-74633]NYT40057.1 DUF2939 domain-containing protein [Sphingomonas sp. R-74633]